MKRDRNEERQTAYRDRNDERKIAAVRKRNEERQIVAVMGVTGSGKSYFISHTSKNANVQIGNGLQSCTSSVECVTFDLDGQAVSLVDTPGFDDTNKSDTEILKLVSEWLAQTYENGIRLKGILYLHRISDVRMGGSALRNLSMFKKLCGESCYSNVILMTTRWDTTDKATGESREAELADSFWKPMIARGSKMLRYATDEDGIAAVKMLVNKEVPITLKIQTELVDEHKELINTGAGNELAGELKRLKEKYEKERKEFESQMKQAIADKDKELHDELDKMRKEAKANRENFEKQEKQLKEAVRNAEKRAKAQVVQLSSPPPSQTVTQTPSPASSHPCPLPSHPSPPPTPRTPDKPVWQKVVETAVDILIPPLGILRRVLNF